MFNLSSLQQNYQSTIQPYVATVGSYLPTSTQWTQISSVWCGINAAEMGARTIGSLFSGKTINQNDLSKDLSGALFYGLCAVNPIPGAARTAAIISTVYAVFAGSDQNSYFTWQVMHKTVKALCNYVIAPIFTHVIDPCLEAIWKVVKPIFNFIYEAAVVVIRLIGSINIPFNSTWFALGCLTVATIAYRQWK